MNTDGKMGGNGGNGGADKNAVFNRVLLWRFVSALRAAPRSEHSSLLRAPRDQIVPSSEPKESPRLPERSHCYGANFRREQESRAKASQPTMYSPPSRLRGKPRDLCGRCFRAAGVRPPQYPRPVAPCGRSRQSALQRGANLLALLLQSPKSIAQGRLCPCFPAPAPPRTKGDALLR